MVRKRAIGLESDSYFEGSTESYKNRGSWTRIAAWDLQIWNNLSIPYRVSLTLALLGNLDWPLRWQTTERKSTPLVLQRGPIWFMVYVHILLKGLHSNTIIFFINQKGHMKWSEFWQEELYIYFLLHRGQTWKRWPFFSVSMLFDPRYPELQMMKVELSVQRKFLYKELRG